MYTIEVPSLREHIFLDKLQFLLVYFRFETKMSEDKKRDDGMQVNDSDVTVSAQK